MSIELEYAMEHKNDPAVLCCRAEQGLEISHHNLEDPAIFPDLIDSGLLNVEGALTIGQCIGATLTKTSDSLTPLTEAIVSNIQEVASEAEEEVAEESVEGEAPVAGGAIPTMTGGTIKLYIEEGKDIKIEFSV